MLLLEEAVASLLKTSIDRTFEVVVKDATQIESEMADGIEFTFDGIDTTVFVTLSEYQYLFENLDPTKYPGWFLAKHPEQVHVLIGAKVTIALDTICSGNNYNIVFPHIVSYSLDMPNVRPIRIHKA